MFYKYEIMEGKGYPTTKSGTVLADSIGHATQMVNSKIPTHITSREWEEGFGNEYWIVSINPNALIYVEDWISIFVNRVSSWLKNKFYRREW